MGKIKSICVFCGARSGVSPVYEDAAQKLAGVLFENDITLVYGGGKVGIMGALANEMLRLGGKVIGIIPSALQERELAHRGVTELHVVDSMHTRKALMAAKSDAFIMLPGGYGTLEELVEAVTWNQLGLQKKPCGVLNVVSSHCKDGYFDNFLKFLDVVLTEGFMDTSDRYLIKQSKNPRELLELLFAQADLELFDDRDAEPSFQSNFTI